MALQLRCPLIQVETDVVVPIETVSQKEEYTAATIRPKILKHLETFQIPLILEPLQHTSIIHDFESLDLTNISTLVSTLPIDHSVKPSPLFHGGTSHALQFLRRFIHQKLPLFSELRNDPRREYCSYMSQLAAQGVSHVRLKMHGIHDAFIDHGSPDELYRDVRLDAAGIASTVAEFLQAESPVLQRSVGAIVN